MPHDPIINKAFYDSIANKNLKKMAASFISKMEDYGYDVYPQADRVMPTIDCRKDGHYRIKAICFNYGDPAGMLENEAFVVEGTYGIDIRPVFYFSINAPFEDFEMRFEKLMEEAKPYIEKEVGVEENRKEF